jgi:uncharacterized protein (DUF1810 family)
MPAAENFDPQRFLDAQSPAIERARAELARERKQSHWMWFVFPQVHGLGRSAMAERYAIASLGEAQAYAAHPLLGARLRELTALVVNLEGRSAYEIFGTPDDLKFHSSMTLFARAAPDEPLFRLALGKYFAGREDAATVEILAL